MARSLKILVIVSCTLAGCAPLDEEATDGGMDAARADDAGRDVDAADPPPTPGEAFAGPSLLSETGLYADLAAGTLAEGVMPYRVRFELWSDGAEKQRWLLLPTGTQIDTSDPDRWVFPVGTRAWKEFRSGGIGVETRFLHKVAPDRWENVAYVWRADGSEADARPDGAMDALGTTHDVPDLGGCFDCHRGTDGLNGVSAIQLATGEADDLLSRLETAGLLTDAIDPRPSIPGSALEQSALGYLHANCGHCHNEVHPLGAIRVLRMRVPLGLTDPLSAPSLRSTAGAEMHHLIDGTTIGIVPGDPLASQVYARMLHRDAYQMPPRGTEQVDPTGSELVRTWLESLPSTLP
jgi:hypothetical protein